MSAGAADAVDDELAMVGLEAMLLTDLVLKAIEIVAHEFRHAATFVAVEVLVLGIAVTMLERTAATKAEFAKKASLDKQRERSINGGAADPHSPIAHALKELVGLEMIVPLENVLDDLHPLASHFEFLQLKELAEFIDRELADRDRGEVVPFARVAVTHGIAFRCCRCGAHEVQYTVSRVSVPFAFGRSAF